MAEVFRLHPVCQVDIGTDLSLVPLITDEQDRSQTPIPKTLLPISKCLEECISRVGVTGVSKRFYLGLLLVLTRLDSSCLALLKLLASQKLGLTVASNLVELADELSVLQVEEVLISALRIKIVLKGGIFVQVGVEQVSFVVLCHIQISQLKLI